MSPRGTGGASADASVPVTADAEAERRELLRRVCETPAPTGDEGARAARVRALLEAEGLEPWTDPEGSVLVRIPGGRGPRVALVAHLDTVFGPDAGVRVREGEDGRWRAPGIGDNSASVAVTLRIALEAARGRLEDRPRLLLAFTVGEEGLGDLRGARGVVRDHREGIDLFVAIDGHLGTVVDAGVGSRRFRVGFEAEGGHSWGDYPSPSAVHALGDAVHALARLPVPQAPRSSMNVGQVGGGSSINAIAEEAWLSLDLRSLDPDVLDGLATEAEKRVRSVARRHEVRVRIDAVGDRPAGRSDRGALAAAAVAALRDAGHPARRGASSTDANAAMAAALPAICLGVYRGGDAHRRSEWLWPESLGEGEAVLRGLLARLAAGEADAAGG